MTHTDIIFPKQNC